MYRRRRKTPFAETNQYGGFALTNRIDETILFEKSRERRANTAAGYSLGSKPTIILLSELYFSLPLYHQRVGRCMVKHVIVIDQSIPEPYREIFVRAVLMEKNISTPVNVRVVMPSAVTCFEVGTSNTNK